MSIVSEGGVGEVVLQREAVLSGHLDGLLVEGKKSG